MRKLTVYYDERCEFCVQCRRWLESEPKLLSLEFAPSRRLWELTSRERLKEAPGLAAARPSDLVVVDDEGGIYLGPKAFIMCLYALKDYREWSRRLSAPGMSHVASAAFLALSAGRGKLSALLRATRGGM